MVMDKQDNLDAQPLFIVRYKDELQYYRDIFAVYQFYNQPYIAKIVMIASAVLAPVTIFLSGGRGFEIIYITVLALGLLWLVLCAGGKEKAWDRAVSGAERSGKVSYGRRRNIFPEEQNIKLQFYDSYMIEESINETVRYTYGQVKAILYYEDMLVFRLGERIWERLIMGIPLQGLVHTDREAFLSFIGEKCTNAKKGIQQ